jgi:hypothetical protein
MDLIEESTGIDDTKALLQMMTEAETVYLSASCYFTLARSEWPLLLVWINNHLPEEKGLAMADLPDSSRLDAAATALRELYEKDDEELPLLALHILKSAVGGDDPAGFAVHDEDEVWETPLIQDGEVVTAETEIDEYDTYMFG